MAVLTTGRQDYGILRSTIFALREDGDFDLRLWAGGMHLSARFGVPLESLASDGLSPSAEIAFLHEPPRPVSDAARAVDAVGDAIARDRPDALMLVGDRTETLAAGVSAAICRVPIIHLHGGEESQGVIDNACRHALTKLSHLHLVANSVYAARVIQMGENPSDVVVVGAPGNDNLYRDDLPSRATLEQDLGIALADPVVVVTLHPATLGDDPGREVAALADAMARVPATYVVTQPNSDQGAETIRQFWTAWSAGRSNVRVVDTLGAARYWGLLRIASALGGNSSSGIIEGPAAGIPVVNIGKRQQGRLRTGRIFDVDAESARIVDALQSALSSELPRDLEARELQGPAAPRIVEAVRHWRARATPVKEFFPIGAEALIPTGGPR